MNFVDPKIEKAFNKFVDKALPMRLLLRQISNNADEVTPDFNNEELSYIKDDFDMWINSFKETIKESDWFYLPSDKLFVFYMETEENFFYKTLDKEQILD